MWELTFSSRELTKSLSVNEAKVFLFKLKINFSVTYNEKQSGTNLATIYLVRLCVTQRKSGSLENLECESISKEN